MMMVIQLMQSAFANKEIVWAKVKGYPWWPAQVELPSSKVAKLPTPDHNVFKVVFIAEDTHAFLNPRDVRKYGEFYEECSKKKMRGLGPAIMAADELYKQRVESAPKSTSSPQKSKGKNCGKSKPIKKAGLRNASQKERQSAEEEDEQSQQITEKQLLEQAQPKIKPVVEACPNLPQKMDSEQAQESSSSAQEQSLQQQKFLNESEQKVDRSKIDSLSQSIYRYIEQIKQSNYRFTIEHFRQITSSHLTDEELLQSKITNMLSFIIHSLRKEYNLLEGVKENPKEKDLHAREKEELKQLIAMQKQLKERILRYLNDTSYYDQYLKLIQRNKKNRNDYENRLISYLKTTYKVKKELALIFASRLMTEINNGALVREKQLLEDIKEHRVEIANINNKAAIDRSIENMIPKYM